MWNESGIGGAQIQIGLDKNGDRTKDNRRGSGSEGGVAM